MHQGTLKPLRNRLASLRARLRATYLGYGLTRILQLAVAGVLLTFLMDWFLDLPRWVRAFHASLALIVGILTVNRFVIVPLLRTLSDEELAILVEKTNPQFRDRLISALQLTRSAETADFADSREMVAALAEEAVQSLESSRLAPVVDRKRILRALGLASVGAVTVLFFAFSYPQVASIYAQRNLGLADIPWPQKTFLEVLLPNEGENLKISDRGAKTVIRIARGSDLKINVKANGRVPGNVELFYESVPQRDGEDRVVKDRRSMNRIGDRDFTYQFLALTQSFYFHVEGGDDNDRDPVYWVDVQPTPRVKSIQVEVIPPVYTGLEPQTLQHGNVEAPEGSLLRLRLETNMDVTHAGMTITGQEGVSLDRSENQTFLTTHVLRESLSYSFDLLGSNGLRNRDPLRYTLTAVPDTTPRVHLTLPGVSDLDATPQAVVPIKLTISDDHGLKKAWLMFKLGRELPEKKIALDPSSLVRIPGVADEEAWTGFTLLDLAQLPLVGSESPEPRALEVGDRIRYLAVAEDGHTEIDGSSTPNLGTTSENRISLVTRIELERKLEELRRRLREDVRKLQRKQENLHDRVVVLVSPGDDGAPGATARDENRLDPREKEAILDAEVGQSRLQTEGKRLATDLARIFDVHLFNRLEEGTLTEKVIGTLFEAYQEPDADPLDGYRRVIGDYARGTLGDSDQIGKMIEMLTILFRACFDHVSEAASQLKAARSTLEPELRQELLQQAADAQNSVVADLELLLGKMEEWEDFQSIIQQTRDLIESQKGVKTRTRHEINSRGDER